MSLCRSYLFYLRQFYASLRWRYADILETSMLDHIKNPSNFKQFLSFFFLKRMQERYINRVAAYNIIKGEIYLFVSDKNLNAEIWHYLNFTSVWRRRKIQKKLILLKIKIPYSLFKKRKKRKITKNLTFKIRSWNFSYFYDNSIIE